ncbi:hydroxyacylglutathione hydrolase [Enterobacteriaceae bacterium BIT-l23]|uniref:hydroxyacylglutathione hydrolase n=1 Tax=Jejubacter sp. L23 TaxID=3092086 RepID=UPI0015845194|nr:hydroxyacylglutathione hydrolase [Enterobacteriaceae bacterium BIT-l23]
MNLTSIPAFQDNYIWVLHDETGKCLIVDPGDAAPVQKAIEENDWHPEGILLTHHHQDHVGGVKKLLENYPNLPVWGPQETQDKGANRIVIDGDRVAILGLEFSVFATPGHTLGHICWYAAPWLFCGDTLFSGGCGRLFEGTPEQMFLSFQRINQLPEQTLICCAHEYTESNLAFALSILPEDVDLNGYYRKVKELRVTKQKTLPSTLKIERRINIFLRTEDSDFIKQIKNKTNLQQSKQLFAWLRAAKDNF